MKLKNLIRIALFAALIAVCSWITVPSPVPFTLQTFAVCLTLFMLGGKLGTVSVAVYIAVGAVGVPVFSGFKGGIGILLSNTGGYITGFLFMGTVYWLVTDFLGNKTLTRIFAATAGNLVLYVFGTLWFVFVYTSSTGEMQIGTALMWCVVPFLIPDALKLALAAIVSSRLKKLI